MTAEIGHDLNGPFVRAARMAGDGQTERVFAERVEYADGTVEYWNAGPEEPREGDRSTAFHHAKERGTSVLSFQMVSRLVTISATDWEVSK